MADALETFTQMIERHEKENYEARVWCLDGLEKKHKQELQLLKRVPCKHTDIMLDRHSFWGGDHVFTYQCRTCGLYIKYVLNPDEVKKFITSHEVSKYEEPYIFEEDTDTRSGAILAKHLRMRR